MGKVEKCVVYDLMKMRLEEEAADPARIELIELGFLMDLVAGAVQRGTAEDAFGWSEEVTEYEAWVEVAEALKKLGIGMEAGEFVMDFVNETVELMTVMEMMSNED